MAKHDASRREFLVRAAVGAGAAAGAAASAGLVPGAAAHEQMSHMEGGPSAPGQQHPNGAEHGAFFNHADAATIAAFTERIMPSEPGKPGARDADVLNYIDLALAGAYAELQDFYRRGIASLDAHCRATYKESFIHLAAEKQDEVIAALEEGKASEFTYPTAREFFVTLRVHTMEGMFADPLYGGNRDFAGWRLVGFPGAQAIFTPSDLKSTAEFTRAPIVGLQTTAKGPMGRG
ncbi:MAG TPA: gluconate 2-dehydrogenase subunit 3 family protein [Verrucomicrobiae bacterium]|jgi:gluconate 2-dehydrogenase gamma chain|nr:gluconate 2-dehydrogenase subunit 3 family protein [Verrucomicrobiae bacterium]